ncbi:unnamed protein product, partial [Adineta ricciae]
MILPQHEMHWKIAHCPIRRIKENEYRISIELKDKKRQYSCISFEDLFKLIQRIQAEKRTFYEHISRGDAVKFYLDFEYYRIAENSIVDNQKSLLTIRKLFVTMIRLLIQIDSISEEDMIILESSSCEKHSYHMIFDNEHVRFIDTDSLHLFIRQILRYILLNTLKHKCVDNRNYLVNNINDDLILAELMEMFERIRLECFSCTKCK